MKKGLYYLTIVFFVMLQLAKFYVFLFFNLQNHDGLIERWKRKNMDNILELHNKSPVWNDGMK